MGAILAAVGSLVVPLWVWFAGPDHFEFGTEYFVPIHENRQIETISSNFMWIKNYGVGSIDVQAGLTLTRPWGEIEQLDENLQTITLKSGAWGVGPVFLFRWNLWPSASVHPILDCSGATIYYDRQFPGGGERYNFMGRFGAGFGLGSEKSLKVILKYEWMHVSNGRGLVPNNPSYEGKGPYIGFRFAF